MDEADKERLFNEASDLFLRVKDYPEDPAVQRDLEAFLARGEAERQAFRRVQKIWVGSGQRKRPSTTGIVVGAALLFGVAYWSAEPLRIMLVADHVAGRVPVETVLASGDVAILDAGSALADDTDLGDRDISLLRGAAYFDVVPDPRPFTVTLGDVQVRALGTAFETIYLDTGVSVAVTEGIVEVRSGASTWQLDAGETLYLSDQGEALERETDLADMATWRAETLVVEDLALADVADILDRRLPGSVQILSADLAAEPVSGGFDLTNPDVALQALAATVGARLDSLPNVVHVIRSAPQP